MKATKLIVTAQETSFDMEGAPISSLYDFTVFEFENGLILVPSDSTNDWFFENRDLIEANGCAEVLEVESTDTVIEWDLSDLAESIKGAQSEFGSDRVPSIALDLINA